MFFVIIALNRMRIYSQYIFCEWDLPKERTKSAGQIKNENERQIEKCLKTKMFWSSFSVPQTLCDKLFLFLKTLTPAMIQLFPFQTKNHGLSIGTEYLIRRVNKSFFEILNRHSTN